MIAIIDYDAGNTCSVMNALNRLNADFVLSGDPAVIRQADRVIFPGVGHAAAAMESLKKNALVDVIKQLQQPVLGICVGMQLLCDFSEEGNTPCLGILPLSVKRFDPSDSLKVPHMGWNTVRIRQQEGLFNQIDDHCYFYFVHSYYVPECDATSASCNYDVPFSASIRKNNFFGIQFHAEKSGDDGELLLSNFINHVL